MPEKVNRPATGFQEDRSCRYIGSATTPGTPFRPDRYQVPVIFRPSCVVKVTLFGGMAERAMTGPASRKRTPTKTVRMDSSLCPIVARSVA